MNDEEIFVYINDLIQEISLDSHPDPTGELSLSEVLTLMVTHSLLKPGVDLKQFHRWLEANCLSLFPNLVAYSRLTRLFVETAEFLGILLQRGSDPGSFDLVADGNALPVMHAARDPYAKRFRNARKVKSASKRQWYRGFILELVIEQQGLIAFFSVGVEAEIRQLENILEDLADRWVPGDLENRSQNLHERLWDEKQIRIKLTGGKERQWIENVIGTLKDRLGLWRIRKVRKMPSFLARLKAVLCAYNLLTTLHLPIWPFELIS